MRRVEGEGGPSSAVASAVARDGYRGPTRAEKKMYAGDGATRADKKAGKNYFGGSEGAGEKEKSFRRERKKIWRQRRHNPQKKIILAGAKKNSGVNEDTTHKKAYVP